MDDSLSILTFYVGNEDTIAPAAGRRPGRYDGPDTEKDVQHIISLLTPGVLLETNPSLRPAPGNGLSHTAPGDHTLTPTDEWTCEPTFAWPSRGRNGTFRTQLIEGFVTFTFFDCKTDATVELSGTTLTWRRARKSSGGCRCSNRLQLGPQKTNLRGVPLCETTNEEGVVVHQKFRRHPVPG